MAKLASQYQVVIFEVSGGIRYAEPALTDSDEIKILLAYLTNRIRNYQDHTVTALAEKIERVRQLESILSSKDKTIVSMQKELETGFKETE